MSYFSSFGLGRIGDYEREASKRQKYLPATSMQYDNDCGWYALKGGCICQPEIDGTLRSARRALAWASIDWAALPELPPEERLDNEPGYCESLTPWAF